MFKPTASRPSSVQPCADRTAGVALGVDECRDSRPIQVSKLTAARRVRRQVRARFIACRSSSSLGQAYSAAHFLDRRSRGPAVQGGVLSRPSLVVTVLGCGTRPSSFRWSRRGVARCVTIRLVENAEASSTDCAGASSMTSTFWSRVERQRGRTRRQLSRKFSGCSEPRSRMVDQFLGFLVERSRRPPRRRCRFCRKLTRRSPVGGSMSARVRRAAAQASTTGRRRFRRKLIDVPRPGASASSRFLRARLADVALERSGFRKKRTTFRGPPRWMRPRSRRFSTRTSGDCAITRSTFRRSSTRSLRDCARERATFPTESHSHLGQRLRDSRGFLSAAAAPLCNAFVGLWRPFSAARSCA